MRNGTAKRVAFCGMLFALALALSWLEGLVAPALGLMPGIKLGLANIVVLYALLFLSRGTAALLVVLKAGFAFLARGSVVAGALSLAGGGLSFLVMVLLLALPGEKVSVLVLSVCGALCHNLGQLLVVRLWMGSLTWYYAPVLILSGVVMGAITAASLRVLLPALRRTLPPGKTAPGAAGKGHGQPMEKSK